MLSAPGRILRYMSSTTSRFEQPLITVLGATGTGKSELAVSLARRFNGEVINGDALQLYEGLPIVTNKISIAEQHGIKHHLLGAVPLTETTWIAPRFTREAVRLIADIRARGKLPVLAGGTHYYLQSLLFEDALVTNVLNHDSEDEQHSPEFDHQPGDLTSVSDEEKRWPILKASPEEIRAELQRVDPVIATRWHPNDHRKIRRSLAIYLQTGHRASDIYAEQTEKRKQERRGVDNVQLQTTEDQDPGFGSSPNLRYNNLLFWVYTKTEVLEERLHKRVDKMVERGLLEELKQIDHFRKSQEAQGHEIDQTRGIWVAIGYKQFDTYLKEFNNRSEQSPATIEAALAEGKEKTFFATRQYARTQNKWIRTKLLPSLEADGIRDRLFLLDSTQPELYKTQVEDQAAEITTSWLAGESLPKPRQVSPLAAEILGGLEDTFQKPERSSHFCELCELTMMTEADWDRHLKSGKHKAVKRRIMLIATNPRYAAAQEKPKQKPKQKDKGEEKHLAD